MIIFTQFKIHFNSQAKNYQITSIQACISMLCSSVVESLLPSHTILLIKEMLQSMQLFGSFFIQNERSWQCLPFKQRLQALSKIRDQW